MSLVTALSRRLTRPMIVMMRVIHRIISIQAHELLKAATIEKPRLPPYRGLETSFYYPKNRDRLGQRKHPSTQGQYRRPCWVTIDVPGEQILARQLAVYTINSLIIFARPALA
ncbi:hypothetical protein [Methylocystis sp.]|uniref:hypothetical protein n=1 Tax=Methylocystis sp. TaxID=1911079 RepID=UPI003DA2CCBB